MYYNLKYFNYPKMQNIQPDTVGYVRILHAVPDAPSVDLYANGNLIVQNLAYGQYTSYLSVPVGTYEVSLYVAGTMDSPVLSNMLTVNANSIITVAAADTLSNIGFVSVSDENVPIDASTSMIRFVHLSPNAPAVDITLPDGTVIFSDVSFEEATQYTVVEPGEYTLQVRVSSTPTVALTVPDIMLEPDNFYTVYAIGLVGESPELEALLLVD